MSKQSFHISTLGEKLRHLRDSKNLMQREVGNVIDVDGAFISKVENNEKPLNRNHLPTLSKFFNVPEDELQILWLADKIRLLIKDEKHGKSAIQTVLNDFK
jgi:HTH-type transcriptional regulator, competence development regulator